MKEFVIRELLNQNHAGINAVFVIESAAQILHGLIGGLAQAKEHAFLEQLM